MFGVLGWIPIPARAADSENQVPEEARRQLQEALGALTTRIGCPTVGEGATWRPPLGINGPQRLPITFPALGRRLTVTTA